MSNESPEATNPETDGPSPVSSALHDVPLEISVELGRTSMTLAELVKRLGPGSVIPLDKMTGEKLDVRINQRLIARAEAVAVGERTAIRIVEIVPSGEADQA